MSTSKNSLERYRQWIIVGTTALKIGLVAYGVYVTLAVYRAGLEWLALSFGVGGGLYILVNTVANWREGRKPWIPSRRVVAAEFRETTSIRRGAVVGVIAARLTVIGLWAFVTYTVYQAELVAISVSFVLLGVTYAVARTALDLRAGRPPWLPMKRVPLFD